MEIVLNKWTVFSYHFVYIAIMFTIFWLEEMAMSMLNGFSFYQLEVAVSILFNGSLVCVCTFGNVNFYISFV